MQNEISTSASDSVIAGVIHTQACVSFLFPCHKNNLSPNTKTLPNKWSLSVDLKRDWADSPRLHEILDEYFPTPTTFGVSFSF